ncbi:unnamed protein product, partial [Mesorhabditis belari]|uniref:ShKT domain-containing protein n=1 Tax=Mesorhabditis belari TaxID=2138241 RepID=A0AAF3FE37_9BILA
MFSFILLAFVLQAVYSCSMKPSNFGAVVGPCGPPNQSRCPYGTTCFCQGCAKDPPGSEVPANTPCVDQDPYCPNYAKNGYCNEDTPLGDCASSPTCPYLTANQKKWRCARTCGMCFVAPVTVKY